MELALGDAARRTSAEVHLRRTVDWVRLRGIPDSISKQVIEVGGFWRRCFLRFVLA